MAKKVFYNRRYKMPAWGQLYAVWGIIAAVALGILFFTSVEKVANETVPRLSLALNGFAEGLYYELRDGDANAQAEVIVAHAKRLEKKHGYKMREEKSAGCKVVQLSHGKAPHYGLATEVSTEKSRGAFALLTFLDRVAAQNPAAAINARVIFSTKACDREAAISAFLAEGHVLPMILGAGEATPGYDAVPQLKNLKARRYFEQLFLMRDRTLWANTTAILSSGEEPRLTIAMPSKWSTSPEAQLAQNPLLNHPAGAKGVAENLESPVALYLAADYQLLKGGFICIAILAWFLAVIPFMNALGTFRERFDIGSALTSTVLYCFAFFAYLLLLKLVLQFAKSDLSVILLTFFLLPAVFIPVRILQKSVLRAELNRAGLHLLIQFILTIFLFMNPLMAFMGFACLMLVSGFSRADVLRKILRFSLLMLLFVVFILATRQPLGSFTNFFAALLPVLSVGGVFKMLFIALVGGNLVALTFVPRERV